MKNRSYHSGIKRSPYETLSAANQGRLKTLPTEEDLEKAITSTSTVNVNQVETETSL